MLLNHIFFDPIFKIIFSFLPFFANGIIAKNYWEKSKKGVLFDPAKENWSYFFEA